MPGERELHGGVGGRVRLAGFRVHRGGSGEQFIDIDSLQRGRHEAHGGQHRGAAADPVFHRETGDEALCSSAN
jgi:hypothetical protein